MEGEKPKPLNRSDFLKLIEEKGGKTQGLDLSQLLQFEDGVDLSGLDLSGIKLHNARLFRANFNGSILDGAIFRKANMDYATFNLLGNKPTSLKGTIFSGAHLNRAQFRKAELTAAQFQGESQGDKIVNLPAFLDETDFREANLFRADFTGCRFYGTKFEGAFIRGAEITEAYLGQVDWGNYKIGEENKKDELHFAQYRYRQLKMWYEDSGYNDIAAKFYYREKEAGRKQLNLFSKDWRHRITMETTRMLFGYGEDWKRVFFWMLLIILGSSALFSLFGGLKMLDSLYFSIVSFTALGYGSWVTIRPQGWVQAIGAAESFIGVFMIALVLVTFVRKWTR